MQNGASYIIGSNDFINKVKDIDIPKDALQVTADVEVLYQHEISFQKPRF